MYVCFDLHYACLCCPVCTVASQQSRILYCRDHGIAVCTVRYVSFLCYLVDLVNGGDIMSLQGSVYLCCSAGHSVKGVCLGILICTPLFVLTVTC